MKAEQSIIQLKNRAENLSARAATYREKTEAEELVKITNTIIDYYNEAEQRSTLLKNATNIIQVLCEYLGIEQYDIDILKQIDAEFLRKRLLYRIDEPLRPKLLFHNICTDNTITLDTLRSMNYIKQDLSIIKGPELLLQYKQLLRECELFYMEMTK